MFGFGRNKSKKNNQPKPPPQQNRPAHARMSTEEQINYALQVSLQESQGGQQNGAAQGQEPAPLPAGYDSSLIQATQASMGHQRMTTAEQINLAVKMSLEESGQGATEGTEGADPEPTPEGPPATAGNHKRMNTEQAIQVAIAKSLQESRLPEGPPKKWTAEALASWVNGLNDDYESYAENLKKQGVDGEQFAALSKEDYKQYSIRNRNHRDNIYTAFHNELKKHPEEATEKRQSVDELNNNVSDLFRDDEPAPVADLFKEKEEKKETQAPIMDLFQDDPEPEPAVQRPPKPSDELFRDDPKPQRAHPKAQDSFGGVASLFGESAQPEPEAGMGVAEMFGEAQEEEPVKEKKGRGGNQPSYGGVYGIFGQEEEPMTVANSLLSKDEDEMDMSADMSSLAQKYDEAQRRIENLEKRLEGERREKRKLEGRLKEETAARKAAESELAKARSQASPAATQENDNNDKGDVAFGFISFKENTKEEGHIHKRDPSFTGVSGLFDDLNFDSDDDEPLNEPTPDEEATPAPPKKSDKDRHKRDPSFSGVADMFDDDEAEEMGFGSAPSAVDNFTNSTPVKGKKKRDPSFSGISDLFAEEEEEEEVAGFTYQGPTSSSKKKRDPSFSGVSDLFAEEEEEEEPVQNFRSSIQETQIEELRSKIRNLEEKLVDYNSLQYDYQMKEEEITTLKRELELRSESIEKIRQRENELEGQNKQLREEFTQRLKDVSNSKDVEDIIQEELSRTKSELEEKAERLRSLENEADHLSRQVRGKDDEINILKTTISKENRRCSDLERHLQESREAQQQAESELQIRKETYIQDNHHEALVDQQVRNQKLEDQNKELQNEINSMEKKLSATQESKLKLVISVSQELDRMREQFREIAFAQTGGESGRAKTVG